MRQLLAGLLAFTLVTAVGCGSDDNDNCADIGRKIEACSGDPAEEIQAECEAILEATVCEGSKQDAIDCIMGMTCEELDLEGPDTCLEAEGCTIPVAR